MIFNTPIQLVNAYSNGFIGSVCDERGREKLLSESKHPYFGSAAQAIAGSGKGKVALAFKSLLRFDIRSFNERQVTGDCRKKDGLILGPDFIKKIQDIKIGDRVYAGDGSITTVISTMVKKSNNPILKIYTKGGLPLEVTSDHKLLVYRFGEFVNNNTKWRRRYGPNLSQSVLESENNKRHTIFASRKAELIPAKELTEADYLLCPISFKIDSKIPEDMLIYMGDKETRWLIGLFLGDGHANVKSKALEWGCTTDEPEIEKRLCSILDLLNITWNSYFHCLKKSKKARKVYTHKQEKLFNLFRHYFYDSSGYKVLPNWAINEDVIQGLLDSDGYTKGSRQYLENTSPSLVLGVRIWALNNGYVPSLNQRQRIDKRTNKTNKIVYSVSWEKDGTSRNLWRDDEYLAMPITKIEFQEGPHEEVFDIGVENHNHTFIDGCGMVLKNCVSHATRNAVDITRACQIMAGSPESFMVRSATEGIYGFRGHGGQGMTCERAVRFVTTDGGILLRKKYDKHDLSNYNGRLGAAWGRSGVPKDLIILAKENQVQTASNIKSVEEARDAIYNGYGVFFCSGLGFSSTRDNNGIAKRSGSWAHAMCYSSDTEILTTRGWVFVSDMKNSDVFYTLNPSTHEIELQSPTDILEFDYNGEMYYFNRRSLDILVTPEHRLYGIKGSRYIENNNPDNYEFIEAEDYSESFKVKLTGNNINNQHILKYKFKNYEINMDVWLEFLGYFISEGCSISFDSERIRADRKNNPYIRKVRRIEISQTKLENLDKIENCLAQLPFNFRRIQNKWVCENSDLNEELMILGKAWEKYIPEYVWDCGIDQLKILANALMLGDGHTDDGEYISYTTTSKKLADDFQRLMLMIGFSANVTKKQPHEKSFGIRDIFSINIRLYHTHVSLGKASKIEYSGKVYCPSTPNGVVYVRRNGKPSWCGNCFIAMDDTRELFDETLFLIQNSWGVWNNGPKRLGQPDGSFWVRQSVAESIIAVGSTWALSNVDGFPAQKINWSFDEVF